MPTWGPDGRRVAGKLAAVNADKTADGEGSGRKRTTISSADRLAADVLTANCPPWCFTAYVMALHAGHFVMCLALGSARAVVAGTLALLLADAALKAVATFAPGSLDVAAQRWTTLVSSLASTPSTESDKRVEQLALLRAGVTSWVARHTTAVDAAAHVRTHLAHVLLGLGSLSLAGLVNTESGLWWTTAGLLWASIAALVARDRLPGLDRSSSQLVATVRGSAVVTWFSPDPDDDGGGDGEANYVVVDPANATSRTRTNTGTGSNVSKADGLANLAKGKANKAKDKAKQVVTQADASAGNDKSCAATSPAVSAMEKVRTVSPAGSVGLERRRRSWSLLDESSSSGASAATSPVPATKPPPPPLPPGDGLMTSTPAPSSNQGPKLKSGWSMLINQEVSPAGAGADVDGRPRGWSVLHDDSNVVEERERGWSILGDDSPKQPAAAGFWEVAPVTRPSARGTTNQTKPREVAVADLGLFDDDDETEWLGRGAGADPTVVLRVNADVDEDGGSRPRGWSMLQAEDPDPDQGRDRGWSVRNDTHADGADADAVGVPVPEDAELSGDDAVVPEEAELPALRSRRGQPGPVASRTRNSGLSPLGATVPAAAGAGGSFVVVGKQ